MSTGVNTEEWHNKLDNATKLAEWICAANPAANSLHARALARLVLWLAEHYGENVQPTFRPYYDEPSSNDESHP